MCGGFCKPMAAMTGRGDVDVGDDLLDDRAAFEQIGALHEHRHADGGLVGDAFVDEAVLAEHEAVVAHVDDQRVVVDAHVL